jgi:hypothetical protein
MAMVVRDENASEERDALLAEALNSYVLRDNVAPISTTEKSVHARSAHDEVEVEG